MSSSPALGSASLPAVDSASQAAPASQNNSAPVVSQGPTALNRLQEPAPPVEAQPVAAEPLSWAQNPVLGQSSSVPQDFVPALGVIREDSEHPADLEDWENLSIGSLSRSSSNVALDAAALQSTLATAESCVEQYSYAPVADDLNGLLLHKKASEAIMRLLTAPDSAVRARARALSKHLQAKTWDRPHQPDYSSRSSDSPALSRPRSRRGALKDAKTPTSGQATPTKSGPLHKLRIDPQASPLTPEAGPGSAPGSARKATGFFSASSSAVAAGSTSGSPSPAGSAKGAKPMSLPGDASPQPQPAKEKIDDKLTREALERHPLVDDKRPASPSNKPNTVLSKKTLANCTLQQISHPGDVFHRAFGQFVRSEFTEENWQIYLNLRHFRMYQPLAESAPHGANAQSARNAARLVAHFTLQRDPNIDAAARKIFQAIESGAETNLRAIAVTMEAVHFEVSGMLGSGGALTRFKSLSLERIRELDAAASRPA